MSNKLKILLATLQVMLISLIFIATLTGTGAAEASVPAHSFDTNQDWSIGDFELLDAIDCWSIPNCELGDFGLLDLIDFWADGCYLWNASDGKFSADCFTQDYLAGKSFTISELDYPSCSMTLVFNNNYTLVTPDGETVHYSIDSGTIVLTDSYGMTIKLNVVSRDGDGDITIRIAFEGNDFEDKTDEWGMDFSIFNNSAEALKDWLIINGFWSDVTITADGRLMRASTSMDGEWWIDKNIFYFAYPDNSVCVDYKAFTLQNDRLLFATDASHTVLHKMSSQSTSGSNDVTGYWETYHTPYGGAEEGPDYWTLTQSGNTISGSFKCDDSESLTGTIGGSTITLSWGEDNNSTTTVTGTVHGNNMEGSYVSSDGDSGTWRGEVSEHQFNTDYTINTSVVPVNNEFDFSSGQVVNSGGDFYYHNFPSGTATTKTFDAGGSSGNYGDSYSKFESYLECQSFIPDNWYASETVYDNTGFDARGQWTRWIKTTEGRYGIVFVEDADSSSLTIKWVYPYGSFTY